MENSNELINWLASGERGISANTMITHITGIDALGTWGKDHPHDPADLSRCLKLCEAVPEIAQKIDLMKTCSSTWSELIEDWDKLKGLLEKEAPQWRENIGSAPKTYELMKKILRNNY